MSKPLLALTFLLGTLLATIEPARAANLPDFRKGQIVKRLGALRKPMSALAQSCRDLLTKVLVRLPIQLEVRTPNMVMRGGGDISSLFDGAKYSADQLTRAYWVNTLDLKGVRKIHLSSAFPESILVRVDGQSESAALRIESQTTSDASNAVVPITSGVPVVAQPGRITFEVEIVADPESLPRLESFMGGLRIRRTEAEEIELSSGEVYSFIATRDDAGVGRFGGIGMSRATIHLAEEDAGVVIFRDRTLVYGRLGEISFSELLASVEAETWDEERLPLLKNFVETLPSSRSIHAAELTAILNAMDETRSQLKIVRWMKPKMTPGERRKAAGQMRDVFTFEDDANKAARILQD